VVLRVSFPAEPRGGASDPATAAAGVIVTGATGLVGHLLLPRLLDAGFPVQAVSRRAGPPGPGRLEGRPRLRWIASDLAAAASQPPRGFDPASILVHAAPLWLLPASLRSFAEIGVRRLVAFGSTSRDTRAASPSRAERETARRLAEAEQALQRGCQEHAMRWTLLRPTLVYGGGRDRNVSDVARVLVRLGFFPVAGAARGLRQPVHAADLATACISVLDAPASFDRAYDLPGGETLSYLEMVSRIARGVGREGRIVRLPLPLLRAALSVAGWLPGLRHVTPAMADRMNEDLVFDAAPARRDFGYDPRPFRFPDEAPPAGGSCS
jgi:nucleoside-diphosphate-sugar epimerase